MDGAININKWVQVGIAARARWPAIGEHTEIRFTPNNKVQSPIYDPSWALRWFLAIRNAPKPSEEVILRKHVLCDMSIGYAPRGDILWLQIVL